jgi:hypothetical protein
LWAIVSRTKIKDMPPEMIGTAVKLLDAKELYDLNGGALGLVPESLKSQAMGGLPSEVRMVLEAEAKLRGMLTSAQSTYKDLERVAVLVGAAPLGAGSRMTPDGRWSYHPDGYFVQYHPSGYSHTTVNIYVPECMTIERDGQGRITRIVDASGKKMDISYSGEGTVVTDDGSVKAHGFATVRCPSGSGRGYTLTGIPRGTGAPTGGGSFPDLAQRLQWAVKATRSEDRGGVFFRGQTVEEEDMNLAHLEYGLTKGGAGAACLELVRKARMYEICRRQGKCSSCGQVVYEPSMSVAQPGNTAKQRLAQSARPYSGH